MLAIIVFVFMITCMSYLILSYFPLFQVVRMLAIIVFVFMITWMPYRIVVVYNSFAKEKYMDLWFLLFSRTMVYINSAINPVLYNAMSVKFRRAFKKILTCGKLHLEINILVTNWSILRPNKKKGNGS